MSLRADWPTPNRRRATLAGPHPDTLEIIKIPNNNQTKIKQTSCLISAVSAAGCAPADTGCQCGPTRAVIAATAAPCLLAACTAADQLVQAQSAGNAVCSSYSATATPGPAVNMNGAGAGAGAGAEAVAPPPTPTPMPMPVPVLMPVRMPMSMSMSISGAAGVGATASAGLGPESTAGAGVVATAPAFVRAGALLGVLGAVAAW